LVEGVLVKSVIGSNHSRLCQNFCRSLISADIFGQTTKDMRDTYTQLSIHVVFSVQSRQCLILDPWRNALHKYIAGILREETDRCLAVGGWKDHMHIFFALKTTQTIADVMHGVKAKSSKWINEHRLTPGKFSSLEGYGAFSHSKKERHGVIQYIMNQDDHHRSQTFREEYMDLLIREEIDFKEQYLFEFFD
jgi:REP element-mobilizing transposase RayT